MAKIKEEKYDALEAVKTSKEHSIAFIDEKIELATKTLLKLEKPSSANKSSRLVKFKEENNDAKSNASSKKDIFSLKSEKTKKDYD